MKRVIIIRCFLMVSIVLLASFAYAVFALQQIIGENILYNIKLMLPPLMIGVITAVIVIPMSAFKIGEAMTKPIKTIGNRLKLIEQGDYNIFLSYPREDEVSPVIITLNTLTKSISDTMRELTSEKQKAQYILNNMDSGLLLVDGDMLLQQYNSTVNKYFSVDDDMIGKNISALTEDKSIISAINKAIANEISSVFDVDLMETCGEIISVRVNPTFGAWAGSSKAVSAIVFITNVTQARKMEQMRSEFVANVSHELKTPITSIKGFAELLVSGVVTDEQIINEYLGRMKGEAERMSSLIDDILRLSSLENITVSEEYENVNIREMAEDILFTLTPQINKKNIAVTLKGSASYKSYPDDMRQLLKNIIENSVNYNTQNGTIEISFSADTNKCKITVADTGIGIPAEDQPRIFERFYRVDKGRSKREGGTGLGLSIVKHIAAKYQGQLTLTSKPDEGTIIRINLPSQ